MKSLVLFLRIHFHFFFRVLIAFYLAGFTIKTRYYYLDDSYIGFQFLRHLVSGHGFTFYPGQSPVEGVTNIGWLAFLAPFSIVLAPDIAAKLVGFILVIITLFLTHRISSVFALASKPWISLDLFVLMPPLLLITNFDFLYFSLSGMETGLLATLLLFMTLKAGSCAHSLVIPLAGWYAFLIHPEAGLVFPLYWLLIWRFSGISGINRRKLRLNLLLFISLVLVTTLARYAYFNSLLPNTFRAKPIILEWMFYNLFALLIGLNANASPILTIITLPLLWVGHRQIVRFNPHIAAMMGSTTMTGLIFSVYALPDWTGMGRYFAPYLPATFIMLWTGTLNVIKKSRLVNRKSRWCHIFIILLATGLILGGVVDMVMKLRSEKIERYPGYVMTSKNLIEPALWIRDHLPNNTVVATRRIGVLSYYSNKRIFDYQFGLTEPKVANKISKRKRYVEDLNDPELAELWKLVSPDCLLEDDWVINKIIRRSGGTRQGFIIHGIKYRVAKSFPIGDGVNWVLAIRVQ